MTGFNSKRKATADKLQKPVREALKLALDALEESQTDNDTMEFWDRKGKAITAIRQALAQPPLPVQRQPLTGEQAKMIFRMARELEDTGRLTSLSESAEREAFVQKNRKIQCALEDYLRNLTETTPPLPVQEPVAYVTGMSFGRFIVEPLNRAMVLPVGMALYSSPQGNT